jgi:DNA-binding PadR family transcriptional regulator
MPKLTAQTAKVLELLMGEVQPLSGADLSRRTGIGAGTLYPMLMRLEQAKWLVSKWEEGEPRLMGRPRRRFYGVTALGAAQARRAAADQVATLERLAWS